MNIISNSQVSNNKKFDLKFIEHIINGMTDWVRVLDLDDNIIYLNKAMAEGLGNYSFGQKCYVAIGRSTPCENCVSRKAIFNDHKHEKEEIIKGRIFSVASSPVKNENGEIIAVVEVLRDITQMKKLQQKVIEQNKKLKDDLSIAKKLQCSLLPKDFPEKKVKFSFAYKPCESLGGDFLDIFNIGDHHVGIYIADVSGHGVPASMLTVFLHSTIDKKEISPSTALKKLFSEFNKNKFEQDLYITVFFAVIDIENNIITYANAGHNVSPVLFGKDRFELLRASGIPISNWLEKPAYTDKSVPLRSGDRLFFYTDGLVEMRNALNIQFGEERLLDILLYDKSEPNGTLTNIIDSACEFAGIQNTSEIPDDITVALLEIR